MRNRKKKKMDDSVEVEMTPMIDVVFQLLIYFVVTFEPQDVMAHLDVFRPSHEKEQTESRTPPKMIRIEVYSDIFLINDRPVTDAELDRLLGTLASIDTSQTIMIQVAGGSPHGKLIDVLDLCAKYRLTNLSVVSAN